MPMVSCTSGDSRGRSWRGYGRLVAALSSPTSSASQLATPGEGSVDLTSQSGTVTSRVLAGHPGDTSGIGLPGLSRIIRVTEVQGTGPIRLRGEEDRGVVHAPFLGRQSDLSLA
jgi:hypothetical protein